MKSTVTLAFLLCWAVGYGQEINLFSPCKSHSEESFVLKSERRALPESVVSDIVFSRLRLTVDPAVHYITGHVTHCFRRSTSGDSLFLMLSDSLVVDSVLLAGQSTVFTRPGADRLTVVIGDGVVSGIDSVAVYYHGSPPVTGFGSFVTSSHDGVAVLWTLSQPYGASDWWPCQNTLARKTDSIDLLVLCPAGNKVASNGMLVSVKSESGWTKWHWKHRYPIADYLVAFAVTNYAYYEEHIPLGGDTLLIANYVYPEDSADRRLRTSWIHDVYPLFDSLFGAYPFREEKYGHAEFGRGGGMEHQTMTFITGFDYDVMVHELAHQWFGDAITCGSWFDLWLNEGWATYATGLAFEHLQEGVYWEPWKSYWRERITSLPDGVIQTTDTLSVPRLFDERLTYGKAAYVLHMLRWVMSDASFYQGVRAYLADSGLLMGFAATIDFQTHMEAASGLDLSHFFDVWLQGEGFPVYTVRWHQADHLLTIRVHQETSHFSVPFYKMPLPVHIYSNGADTLVVLNNDVQDQEFTIDYVTPVDSLVFNRDQWLLTRNSSVIGLGDIDKQNIVDIFPNPATATVSVFLSEPGEIAIFDIKGKMQISRQFGQRGVHIIDLKEISKGIYMIRYRGREGHQVAKLVVF